MFQVNHTYRFVYHDTERRATVEKVAEWGVTAYSFGDEGYRNFRFEKIADPQEVAYAEIPIRVGL